MAEDYQTQPLAFYFSVKFCASSGISDTSFKEVSGISKEVETEEYKQGGEAGYVYRIPKGYKYPRLVLKRGIAPLDSPLVKWCSAIFDSPDMDAFKCYPLDIFLMDETQTAIRGWSFINAYPVKWAVESFGSLKNEVAIESIELEYLRFTRTL